MANEDLTGVLRDLTWDKEGGILLETIHPGKGEEGPKIGDRVFVHYIGVLEDGTVFESSRQRREPFQFTLGKAEVVMAWDCAIANMRKGEVAFIISKPEYAYEAEGTPRHPKVPLSAMVIYVVELIDWKGMDLSPDQDGGIIKRMEKQGQRLTTPVEGAMVTIRYEGRFEGEVFETREVTYTQGEGDDVGLLQGLEIAAQHMKKGELDRLTLSAKYAYGEEGCSDLEVPPHATVLFDVEMVDFTLPKDPLEMGVKEILEAAQGFKEKGTAYYKKGNYQRAVSYYNKVVTYLGLVPSCLHNTQRAERRLLLLAAHLNLAMCHLKLENWAQTEAACVRALELDSNSVKALFRRGLAHLRRCEYTRAVEDFLRVLDLEPGSKAVIRQLEVCRHRRYQAYHREKLLYAHMLGPAPQAPQGTEDGAVFSYAALSPRKLSDWDTSPEW